MKGIVAYRVTRDYNYTGFTGLYTIQVQDSKTLNWRNVGAFYRDIEFACAIAYQLAKLDNVIAYDLGGYQIEVR